MEVVFKERAYYTNENPIPVQEVITALEGLKEAIELVPLLLEELDSSTPVIDLQIYIDELKTGSLLTDLIVKMSFGSQEKFDFFCEDSNKKIHEFLNRNGIKDKNMRLGIICFVALIVGAGAMYGVQKFASLTNSNPSSIPTIQANNNVILNIAAQQLDEDPAVIQKALEVVSEIYGKEKLANTTNKVLAPAKLERGAEIKLFSGDEHDPVYTFDKEYIESVPSPITEKSKYQMNFNDVEILISGMDLVSYTSGWRATIPDVCPGRLPISLPRDVNLKTIASKEKYNVDLIVEYKMEDDGLLKPKRAKITKFHFS